MERGNVVLVNENDEPIGVMEKLSAHVQGLLHRAFSVFVFNGKGELLLQQRASHKYHGGDLWTNSCCSHPRQGEDVRESAEERLLYEMGLACPLTWVYSFTYHAPVENGLIEHEIDHVLVGHCDTDPVIHEDEVRDYKWMEAAAILSDLEQHPDMYTVWFRQAFPVLLAKMKE